MRIGFSFFLFLSLSLSANAQKAKTPEPALHIVPTPRPNYKDTYFYFYTRPDSHAPIIDSDQPMRNTYLAGDTLIRFKILPKASPDHIELVRFETVPKNTQEPIRRGLIPLEYLGEQLDARPTVENIERYQQALKVYKQKEIEERIKKEKDITVQEALAEFHKDYCAGGTKATSEDALKAKWESYIKNSMLTERGQQVAKNAMALDLVARTVLFESQRKEQLPPGAHPKAIDCQWDLIALSIRNRAFAASENSRKAYGATDQGDIIGAATDSQYNVWMAQFIKKNPEILGCFAAPHYPNEKLSEIYNGITRQITKTIGIITDDQPLSPNGFTNRFSLEENEKEIPSLKRIEDFTHYYHPKGMGACHVNERLSSQVDKGYVRIYRSTKTQGETNDFDLFPIVNGKILGYENIRVIKNKKKTFQSTKIDMQWPEWDFDVIAEQTVTQEITRNKKKVIVKKKKTVQIPASEFFKGEAGLLDSADFKESFVVDHYACLPHGILPQCYDKTTPPSPETGYRVPYTWFRKDLRNDMAKSLADLGFPNADKNFLLPKKFAASNPAGVPMKLRCISEEIKQRPPEGPLPAFGGPCDKNIILAGGVDKRLPKITPSPTATEATNTVDQ